MATVNQLGTKGIIELVLCDDSLLDEVFADLFLDLGVFDDDVFPGLGIGARAGVAARFDDLFENLPCNRLFLELPAGVPTPDDFQILGIKVRRCSRGHVLSPLIRLTALSNQPKQMMSMR